MTQKQTMFKGQSKKKTVPPNRHGKAPHIRKGTRAGIGRGVPPTSWIGFVFARLLVSVDFADCLLG